MGVVVHLFAWHRSALGNAAAQAARLAVERSGALLSALPLVRLLAGRRKVLCDSGLGGSARALDLCVPAAQRRAVALRFSQLRRVRLQPAAQRTHLFFQLDLLRLQRALRLAVALNDLGLSLGAAR